MWLVGEACKRFGLTGALAARRAGHGWLRLGRGAWARPSEVQHDTQPQESQDHELVIKEMRNHGNAPTQWDDTGAFYLVFEPTNYPQRGGTRPLLGI